MRPQLIDERLSVAAAIVVLLGMALPICVGIDVKLPDSINERAAIKDLSAESSGFLFNIQKVQPKTIEIFFNISKVSFL